ncbi:hypothetical protein GHT06_015246 [Daphnia sinensis]|uniref:ceramide glucosyltransferase n=1 Tax=Daphnia sinensis TaxID=1820382 RepID=A0AAD5KS52_9CRUS|nr:hypothetical protein GHT06_015246 [Daphnia sinensis]
MSHQYLEFFWFVVAAALFIFWIGYWLVHILAIVYGKWKLHRKSCKQPKETPYPAVSILKPLTGVDVNLFSNLETFFTMQYPVYELLFCIGDESDPSLMLVKKLMEKYPNIDARIFIGGEKVGINPKINNIQLGYASAKYELFMISDSGIRMKEDTLIDMVEHMKEDVGLIHQMPFVCDREGFPATLEKIYFGTAHARIYLAADFVGVNCATGMSALMRKSLIDDAGGLKAFGCYLAEDFFLAKAIKDRGWKIGICSQPAWQNSGICHIPTFQERIIRWAKLRIAMVPSTIIFEPVSECMMLGALAAWSIYWLFEWDPLAVGLLHILAWFMLDWILLSVVQDGPLPFSKFDFVLGWFLRELTAPFLFLNALFRPTIRWKAGIYRLKWGGVVEELKPKVKP